MSNKIASNIKFGKNFLVGNNTVIKDDVVFGNNVEIGNNVVVYEGTKFGSNIKILDNTIIGKQPTPPFKEHRAFKISHVSPVEFGNNIIIGTASIFYAGSEIGNYFYSADRAIVRELVRIGEHVSIGKDTIVEHNVKIGDYTKIQSKALIGEGMILEDHVFIGPYFNGACDKFMDRIEEKVFEPPKIKRYARIGAHVVLVAAVTVGEDSVVGAGAVVTKDVPDYSMVVGIPAKVIKEIPLEQRKKKQLTFPSDTNERYFAI